MGRKPAAAGGSSPAEGTNSMRGSLAQLVERFAYIEDVAGSSPAGSTCNNQTVEL